MAYTQFEYQEDLFASVLFPLLGMILVLIPATLCCCSRKTQWSPSQMGPRAKTTPCSVLGSFALLIFMVVGWTLVVLVGLCLFDYTRSVFDPYKILHLPPAASQAEIRQAYYERSKRLHPDVSGTGDVEDFILLNTAYRSLIAGAGNRNYQLYGHPDGARLTTLGVARSARLAGFYKWAARTVHSMDQWLKIKFT
ncbi:protein translocation protein SEC63-like [Drosophila obscura]|uniref:protein translocation protein SEC63-like n=1 Tax=Drosophila obscura TaxID=7282 RepID=UPI001BB1C15E|nr:protein translocation protein SEC63-like [Drosophila obscura]